MTTVSLRDQILKAKDIKSELVKVEDWPDEKGNPAEIEVRTMTGRERSAMMEANTDENGEFDATSMYPSLLIATCFEPGTDNKLFTDDDADALNEKSAAGLEKVAEVSMRLSGMTKAVKDKMGKDSSSPPKEGSTSK